MLEVRRICDNCGAAGAGERPDGGWLRIEFEMLAFGGEGLKAELCPDCHARMFEHFRDMTVKLRQRRLENKAEAALNQTLAQRQRGLPGA